MSDYIKKTREAWEYLQKTYPDIDETLIEAQNKINEYDKKFAELFDQLKEKYPIEGFEWSIEPNDRIICLESKEWWNEINKKTDTRLEKQYKCVEGVHHFKEINGMKWCSFCGLLIDRNNKYIPENPHFLSSEMDGVNNENINS